MVRKISEEHRKNLSLSHLGYKASDETKRKMSVRSLGNKYSLGKKRTDEQKKRYSESTKGEKHWRWIADRSKLKIGRSKDYDTQYKYWMLEVKKRDNWKCRLLSKDCNGRLEAHHIFNWIDNKELRYMINNGITLCHAHHPRGRAEEKRMIPIFQELLSVSKDNFGQTNQR